MTEDDKLDYLHGMTSKLGENSILIELVNNNDRNAIMLGDYPKAVDETVIARMDTQQGMSLDYLSAPEKAVALQSALIRR
ncbi:hypothetical protein VCX22_21685 [Aeromonas caviae]|uniref:hypothetical protein n=1 Tax=Aeromonas caviae TaxID=648 RepID=UPI002B24456F|nr:hypothetical protein [Aeromonas caviae]MEA9420010.1 hypothetical protein [Aeromonas caviae]